MRRPRPTDMQQQAEIRRKGDEDNLGKESLQWLPDDNRIVALSDYIARSIDGKSKNEVEAIKKTSIEAFIAKLRAMNRQDIARVLPALEAVIALQEHKTADEAIWQNESLISRDKLRFKVERAQAGEQIDISDLEASERSAFFESYYNRRTSFDEEKIKAENRLNKEHKKNFILRWIDKEFKDRKKWDMMQADLKKLDNSAWTRLQDWLRNSALPPDFGLPAKKNSAVRLKPSSLSMTGGEILAKLRQGQPVRPEEARLSHRDSTRAARLKKHKLD